MSEARSAIDVVMEFIGGKPVTPEDQEALRAEFQLMLDTLSMTRESLAALATQANERSRTYDPGENVDPWNIGYLAGKARESQATAGVIGALQNSMDIWATSRRAAKERT